MSERRVPSFSIRGPVTLFVIVVVLVITLSVLWNVALVQDYRALRALAADATFHWSFIGLGSALFVAIIVLSSIFFAQLVGHIRWNQRQSNFISSVSHELNSPLSSIKLFAQTLRQRELSTADRLDFVEKILFDVERLHRLISNILRAAEMDHRGDELQVVTQRVELRGYLRDYLPDARELYRTAGLVVSLDAEESAHVRLDPLMFRQVLDNLVDNAVRYRGTGPPRVELTLAVLGDEVELVVRDRGVGIAEERLPRLFERFYSSRESGGRQHRGTGIGLYVVRSIVAAHEGRVGARSDGLGHGTTLWIRLPRLSAREGHAEDAVADEDGTILPAQAAALDAATAARLPTDSAG
ncbi:MAG: HAMP domain-containing sensor histidine kinase [Acidobacteriota bacterium]